MICEACKAAAELSPNATLEEAREMHKACKGGTHCDCQHKPTTRQLDGSLSQRRN